MNLSDWQKQAKNLLDDPHASIALDYRTALTRQAGGKCPVCGIGNVKDFSSKKSLVVISFKCGHSHKGMEFKESISIRESMKGLVVPEGKSKRHFVIRLIKGWFSSANSKLSAGVYKEQLIDKRNNLYKEKVIDASDDRIIKDQAQPLTDHQGYGSAKFKRDKD